MHFRKVSVDAPPVVLARSIVKYFEDVAALDGVDLAVPAGRIHGLVGPNGAGKTTLLGLLLGLTAADAGTLQVLGTPIGRTRALPEGVAGFVDGPGLYPSLTARRNLAALAALHDRGRDRVGEVLEQVGLAEVADDRVRGFSLGMRQRLGLAAALLTEPRLLVLDEPANGLDPAGTADIHRVITGLVATGTTVVFSSHRMDDLAALCDEVTVLRTGRVVFSGAVGDLAAQGGELDYRVRTSDDAAARRVAEQLPGLSLQPDPRSLVVTGSTPALDSLVERLVYAGIAVRELAALVPPLEAAFLALTDSGSATAEAEPVAGERVPR